MDVWRIFRNDIAEVYYCDPDVFGRIYHIWVHTIMWCPAQLSWNNRHTHTIPLDTCNYYPRLNWLGLLSLNIFHWTCWLKSHSSTSSCNNVLHFPFITGCWDFQWCLERHPGLCRLWLSEELHWSTWTTVSMDRSGTKNWGSWPQWGGRMDRLCSQYDLSAVDDSWIRLDYKIDSFNF